MKLIKKVVIVISVLLIGCIAILNCKTTVHATSIDDELTLHEQTKIYSSNNSDYFYGCEDYDDYVNQSPEITVLTHGLGSKGCYWSNDISVKDGDVLAYNSNSIIDKIYTKLNGEVLIYFVCCESKNTFTLSKLNRYLNVQTKTDRLDDISKHIILIYESYIPYASNKDIYEEFENVLDTISMQYKSIAGVLPRFNLVGHSRGGITNIMYATDHPYNVASMFSLGTPYNGSVLGGIDKVLEMLNYVDKNGNLIPGVQSLLDYNEAVEIRDKWNEAYKEDVNMNVVAYGSMTSIDFVREMVDDAANGSSKYAPLVQEYLDLINTILNVADKHTDLTGNVLDFINGLASVANAFGINLYDGVLSLVSDDLEGSVTYEEGQAILSLYNVINGQAVLMDDLFIDLNSQLGYGFKDDVEFNGFKRYVKIFQVEDLTDNRSIPFLPAVVHNLETMNETYVNEISNALIYGTHNNSIISLSDDSSTAMSLLGERTFSFTSEYTGIRTFTANRTSISLYEYDEVNGLNLIETSTNTVTYEFQKNKIYWFVISKDKKSNITISLELVEELSIGDNIKDIKSNDSKIYKLSVEESGYYLISSSTSNIYVGEAINYMLNGYYVYLSEEEINYIYLSNNKSYDVTANISITSVPSISLEEGEFKVGYSEKIVKFTNTYSTAIQYKLSIEWDTTTSKDAYIYSKNGSCIANIISSTQSRAYYFTLDENESCYIIFSDADNTITANLIVNPLQLKWKIDNTYYDTTTMLARGKKYNLELVLYSDGQEIDYYSDWLFPQKEYFSLSSDGILTINHDALIGYDIIITPIVAPEYSLVITVGYGNSFYYHIMNNDAIELIWNANVYNDSLQNICINISSGGNNYIINLSDVSGTFDITSYISQNNGTSTVSLISVKVSGYVFSNYTSFLNKESIIVNNLFASGSGTSDSPYIVYSYRHLNNIRKNTYSEYKILDNIDLSEKGDWTPINSFRGTINGNGYYIKNMNVSVNSSGEDYGFVKYNYGTIKNLHFSNANIYNSLSSAATVVMYIGVVAGYNGGNISNCNVKNSNIDVQHFKSYVGGICGYNIGTTYNSDINDLNMIVSGYAGSSVGKNSGTIDWCYTSNTNIIYCWKTGNGRVGGTVGYNTSSGNISRCKTSAYIKWISNDDDSDILPCLGMLIGYNEGTYTNCSATGGWHISYYYWHFIGYYDQSDRCFKVDDGYVGYSA